MMGSCSRIALAVATILTLLATAPAFAGQRTFVSTGGVNNPACSLVAPCRDFAAAIAATSPNGEVIVQDSGGYGKVTITQSVSILAAPGVYAGISVFPGEVGVTIAAGATDKVTLLGLTINGQGGIAGIVVNSGDEIHIEHCTVANILGDGIAVLGGTRTHIRNSIVRGNANSGLRVSTSQVHAVDSHFSRNGGVGPPGLGSPAVIVTSGTLDASHVTISDNRGQGLFAYICNPCGAASATVTLSDSVVAGNTSGVVAFADASGSSARIAIARSTIARSLAAGVAAIAHAGDGSSFITVSDSSVVENGNGVSSYDDVGAIVSVTGSTISGNASSDLFQSGGAELRSSGTNMLTGRGAADITGTITPNLLK